VRKNLRRKCTSDGRGPRSLVMVSGVPSPSPFLLV
ncbi:uncharacterized protein METZ01_LOCUS81225, partial [marine metagenome]